MSAPETTPALRVLVVEDDPLLRLAVAAAVRRCGAVVAVAPGVAEALDSLLLAGSDVVLTDLHLGGATGLDLLRAVRRRWPRLPVLVMTAAADGDPLAQAARRGADGFLRKPFGVEELARALRAATASDAPAAAEP